MPHQLLEHEKQILQKKSADKETQIAEITIDTTRAGPASVAAAVPVMVKIPVPTIAPIPKRIKSHNFK